MSAISLNFLCSSEGLVAALCTDRRENAHSVRIWVQNFANKSHELNCQSLLVADADIIIPVPQKLSSLCVQQILSTDSESGILSIVVLCGVQSSLQRYYLLYSTIERRAVHTELLEAEVESPVEHIITNTSSTLIVSFNKLSSRRHGAVVLWSAKLRKLRTLEVNNGSAALNNVVKLVFAGDSEQYVAACYASGMVVGWDAISGATLFTFSCISSASSISGTPALPCAFTTLPSDPQGLAVCVGYEDGVLKYYDLLPSREQRGAEEVRLEPRERLTVDLKRALRFAGMAGRADDGLPRELVLTPLLLYVHDSGVYGQEELCVVVPSGAVLLSVKDGKLVRALSLDELHCSSVSAGTCTTCYTTSGGDGSNGDTHALQIALLTAFCDNVTLYTHASSTTNTTTTHAAHNTRATHITPTYADIDAISQLSLEPDNAQLRAQKRQEMKQTRGSSVYEDESIPLSYFMHSSMQQRDIDDYEGDGGGSSGIVRRSLLEDPPARAATTNSVTKHNPHNPHHAQSTHTNNSNTTKHIPTGRRTSTNTTTTKTTIADKPITFQRKIKSSGYGQIPTDLYERKKYFKQQDALKKQRAVALGMQRSLSAGGMGHGNDSSGSGSGGIGPRIRAYPLDCAAMTEHQSGNDIVPCPMIRTTNAAQTTNTTHAGSGGHAVHHIAYSGDGSLLGVATADCAVAVVKLPVSRYGGEAVVTYLGHTSRVNTVSFTHSRYAYLNCGSTTISTNTSATNNTTTTSARARILPQYTTLHYQLLSSSADGTARMWRHGSTDTSAVVFSHTKHSLQGSALHTLSNNTTNSSGSTYTSNTKRTSLSGAKSSAGSGVVGTYSGGVNNTTNNTTANSTTKETRNRPFGDAVSFASYFYMDKFAVMSVKAQVYMYRYNVHTPDAADDLKRTLATGPYQQVCQWDLSPLAQSVCALACVNSAHSPLLFAATTDKYLNVLDASTGGIARVVESPHTRAIHCIALPRPSVHTALSSEAYNCFLTSAMDSSVYIWDLRTPSPVSKFTGHVCKREHVMCDISPCMRYVATGSEDKSAVLYDIRMGTMLAKLTGHRDVVKCVAFNPLFPQLATASYDGVVKFYADPGSTNV